MRCEGTSVRQGRLMLLWKGSVLPKHPLLPDPAPCSVLQKMFQLLKTELMLSFNPLCLMPLKLTLK